MGNLSAGVMSMTETTVKDYDYLEAYPAKGDSSCERNYKGPMRLYENNNFKIKKEHDNYFVVRKELK